MTKDTSVTSPHYWDSSRPRGKRRLSPNRSLARYLTPILPYDPKWSCLEIGVVPGSYLLWFATEFGYRPTGIDFSRDVYHVREAFEERGIHGEFYCDDFLNMDVWRRFDVVFSCGFVEHFTDHADVVRRHWEYVKPGGFLVVTVPVWSPFQRWIRNVMYTPAKYEEVTRAHVLEVMRLDALRDDFEGLDQCQVITAKHIMEMKVWFKRRSPGVRQDRTWVFPLIRTAERLVGWTGLSHGLYSPACLIVARKTRDESG